MLSKHCDPDALEHVMGPVLHWKKHPTKREKRNPKWRTKEVSAFFQMADTRGFAVNALSGNVFRLACSKCVFNVFNVDHIGYMFVRIIYSNADSKLIYRPLVRKVGLYSFLAWLLNWTRQCMEISVLVLQKRGRWAKTSEDKNKFRNSNAKQLTFNHLSMFKSFRCFSYTVHRNGFDCWSSVDVHGIGFGPILQHESCDFVWQILSPFFRSWYIICLQNLVRINFWSSIWPCFLFLTARLRHGVDLVRRHALLQYDPCLDSLLHVGIYWIGCPVEDLRSGLGNG